MADTGFCCAASEIYVLGCGRLPWSKEQFQFHSCVKMTVSWLDCALKTVYTHGRSRTHTHTYTRTRVRLISGGERRKKHFTLIWHTSDLKKEKKSEQHTRVLQHLGRKRSENWRTPLFRSGQVAQQDRGRSPSAVYRLLNSWLQALCFRNVQCMNNVPHARAPVISLMATRGRDTSSAGLNFSIPQCYTCFHSKCFWN